MKELEFNVKGMMCEGCENRVKNSVGKLDGVEIVEANHRDGKVKVVLNKEVESSVIKERIEDIGYEVN